MPPMYVLKRYTFRFESITPPPLPSPPSFITAIGIAANAIEYSLVPASKPPGVGIGADVVLPAAAVIGTVIGRFAAAADRGLGFVVSEAIFALRAETGRGPSRFDYVVRRTEEGGSVGVQRSSRGRKKW